MQVNSPMSPMMTAADLHDGNDPHGLRAGTERAILRKVAEGADFRDATIEFAEEVQAYLLSVGEADVANGMARLAVEIGAAFGARLVAEEHTR